MTGPVPDEPWSLALYVSGASPRSAEAIDTARRICDEDLGGRVELEIVDVTMDPSKVQVDEIVAVPTLVRRLPLPTRRLTGDLADPQRVRAGLDLPAAPAAIPLRTSPDPESQPLAANSSAVGWSQ